jgi:hypothetical protein
MAGTCVRNSPQNVLLVRIPAILREILEHEIQLHPDLHLLEAEPALCNRGYGDPDAPHSVVLASAVIGDPSVTTGVVLSVSANANRRR